MIGSLMYLTASRPDIMFAICACARFQVTPKVSHLHAVKRIFRYLKGQPKLGLWYPRDSPFNLEAFSDSNYDGASLDRKSTIRERELVRVKIHDGNAFWNEIGVNAGVSKLMLLSLNLLLPVLVYAVRHSLTAVRHKLMLPGITSYCWWKFLIHTILQCLSAKTTAWNEFSSTMASAIICLATNQIFNFSKYIFDNMVKNLEGGVKFLMYPRFVQVFIDKQVKGLIRHKEVYLTPSHTKKVFANIKRSGKGFSGRVTPLFPTMMIQASEDMYEDSDAPSDSHSTPIISQPSSSKLLGIIVNRLKFGSYRVKSGRHS
ncbi:hypothetical protein Tco_1081414 [Tanacetum coccineum]|uniref:Uncharacterized protein n=1 Tax=Tanacetum coccineum TaxID=301880 RepID=A0ABQ5HYD6_9ASTR